MGKKISFLFIILFTIVGCKKSYTTKYNEAELVILHNLLKRNNIEPTTVTMERIANWDENGHVVGLRFKKIKEFDSTIINLKHLRYLALSNSKITKVPNYIARLENLETLLLPPAKLEQFPDCIFRLKKLKRLSFYNYQLSDLPAEFSSLLIDTLDYYDYSNITLPSQISRLTNLKTLYIKMHNTQSNSFPAEICNVRSLESLTIKSKLIDSIPKKIELLSNLQSLTVSSAKLKQIPEELYNLGKLELLDLSNNHLTCIPIGISKLQNLIFLNIEGNNLTRLPDDLVTWAIFTEKVKNGGGNKAYFEANGNRLCSVPEKHNQWLKDIVGAGWRSLQYCPEIK